MNLIQLYKSFLPKDICEELIDFINKNNIGILAPTKLTTKSRYFIPCELITNNKIMNILKKYALELNEKIKYLYKEEKLFVNFGALVKWTEGNSMILHIDTESSPATTTYKYSAIVYLNDDFEGGSTFFNEQNDNYESHPKQGNVLVFTSDNRCPHGVKEITKGERFTYGLWFTDQEKHKKTCFYL